MNQVASERPSDAGERNVLPALRPTGMPRWAARNFALAAVAVMVIDAAPDSWSWLAAPKQALGVVLNRVGLWQGEWGMFAPDPVLNNGCFSAEIRAADGTTTQWDSPYWSEATSGDKFLRFRHLNYYNRLTSLRQYEARQEFVDYLARQSDVPVESIKLYHTRMRLILPPDGSLPPRDELDWMFSSELVAKRSYQQRSHQP